ncbi:MAG: POTRA domain-containing protein, partial [Candidatus Neomarinimicrobiota bacterium]|nr:POTRA domain-containing protein [Candidatus Neomarinimicrobiota bacterium]
MTLRGLIFIVPILGYSQNLTVSEIVHKGNTITKDYIITREIQHDIGISLDSTIAEEDRNRLLNLGIFADVKWRAIP